MPLARFKVNNIFTRNWFHIIFSSIFVIFTTMSVTMENGKNFCYYCYWLPFSPLISYSILVKSLNPAFNPLSKHRRQIEKTQCVLLWQLIDYCYHHLLKTLPRWSKFVPQLLEVALIKFFVVLSCTFAGR